MEEIVQAIIVGAIQGLTEFLPISSSAHLILVPRLLGGDDALLLYFCIGAAQALALFPGISRSGITLAAGLFRGLTRESAARFAFLMGIPIIAGAGFWKLRSIATGGAGEVDPAVLAAGVIASALAGWLAIGILLRYLRTHSTAIFIAYRLIAAAVLVVLLLASGTV